MVKQGKLEGRERMVVMIDPEVVRLTKSVAAMEDRSLWMVVEDAMRAYLKKQVKTKKGEM